ncbi:MAG: hypothetical protein M2R45_03116 [Verrucomicrobia subdivision 3 bacterium]|nr:hypothetical protein [Limisphaerales bacterium]MCS1413184.1 hypothetical protein [Limisphaerales bacterium]
MDLLNFDQTEGTQEKFTHANDSPDGLIQGTPGFNDSTDGIDGEFLTCVELKRGLSTFGVNSDDGFKVTASPSPIDQFETRPGFFNGGRSTADTLFDFVVEEDGVYPMRFLWFE